MESKRVAEHPGDLLVVCGPLMGLSNGLLGSAGEVSALEGEVRLSQAAGERRWCRPPRR